MNETSTKNEKKSTTSTMGHTKQRFYLQMGLLAYFNFNNNAHDNNLACY